MREENSWYRNAFLEFNKLLKYPKDRITKIYSTVKELLSKNSNSTSMQDELDRFYEKTEKLMKSEKGKNVTADETDAEINKIVYGSNETKQEKSFEELEKEALREQTIDDEFDSVHRQ